MSGFKIETIPGAPIIVVTTGSESPGDDQTQDMTDNISKVMRMLDQQPTPVYVIVDMHRLQRDLIFSP